MIWSLAHTHTGNACKISDLENSSAHAQMAWSQKFGKSEISLDTDFSCRTLSVDARFGRTDKKPYKTY